MYAQFGHPKARWPDTRTEWRELIHMRSWQASGLVVVGYYFLLVLAFIQFIANIVVYTVSMGAGGFFLGLFIGTLMAIAMIVFGRISVEATLSIYSIRDSVDEMATRGNAPGMTSFPVPVTSVSNIAYIPPTTNMTSSYQTL